MSKIKTLCLCAGGVVRSVTLANVLSLYWKHEVLAAGVERAEPDTMTMLCEWANHIYVVEPWMFASVPEAYRHKTDILDLGPDIWGMSNHPDLSRICYRMLERELGPDRRDDTYEEITARRERVMAERRAQFGVSTCVDADDPRCTRYTMWEGTERTDYHEQCPVHRIPPTSSD